MQGHDLRRLVTTFLVLALLAGSATLAITSIARERSESPASIARNLAKKQLNDSVPKIGDTALVEAIPENATIEGYDLAAEFSPTMTPRDNFTDTLAKGLAYEFVNKNPTGPEDGVGVRPPENLEEIMNEYVLDAATTPTTYPIDESRIKVAKSYTSSQAQAYLATLDETLAKASGDRGLQGLLVRTEVDQIDEGALQASSFIISDAQDELYAAVVPEPAAELHRSILSYLELNRKLSEPDYATDPLKAVVFSTKFPELRAREEARVRLAVAAFESNVPKMLGDAREPFLIGTLLGARTAHAQWLVSDIKHLIATIFNGLGITGTWATALQEWIRKVATQILKNQIIGRMIQQTVKWVQGGGKPQFITNWKGFLKDVGKDAADSILSYVAPELCSNFASFARPAVQATTAQTRPRQQQQITCTLNQVIQNVRSFYDDFQNGGWAGLLTLIEPANNVYGAIIIANERVVSEIAAQTTAAAQEAESSGGFKGFKRCVNYDLEVVPQSQVAALQRSDSFVGLGPRGCFTDSTTGNASSTSGEEEGAVRVCEVKICRADGKQITTPGGAVAGQLEKALGASIDNIVNAEDLAGLAGVVIDAAITRLIGLAEKGVLGLFGGSDPSGTEPGGGGTGTGPGSGSQGDISAIRTQALQLVTSVETQVRQSSSSAATWQPTASSTQPLLVSVRMTCPAYAGAADQRLGAIDRIAPISETDRAGLARVGSDLLTLRTSITQATSAIAISSALEGIDAINAAAATLSSRIQVRVAQIEGLRNASQMNLANRACNVTLPELDE